ncbi:hypothetical protein LPE01_16540 [Lactiplantibacillus pentosus]|nr:hypothetical protein LPE01_16540 [Lactiplantibacillus pentosus]
MGSTAARYRWLVTRIQDFGNMARQARINPSISVSREKRSVTDKIDTKNVPTQVRRDVFRQVVNIKRCTDQSSYPVSVRRIHRLL